MSIIVDANCAHRVTADDVDGCLILELLLLGRIDFITGGLHK